MTDNKYHSEPPHVFISYSWSPFSHEKRAMELAIELRNEGEI